MSRPRPATVQPYRQASRQGQDPLIKSQRVLGRLLLGLQLAALGPMALGLGGCQAASTVAPAAPAGSFTAGELLVAVEGDDAEAQLAAAGAPPKAQLSQDLWLVEVPAGTEAETARRLEGLPQVRFAEANRMVRTQMVGSFRPALPEAFRTAATVTDPKYRPPVGSSLPGQWGLDMIKAPVAWDTTMGSVTVAVIDTGIDSSHEDLAGNLAMNLAANFLAPDKPPTDDFGHGTHVAGIIGAIANNGLGIAGVAPKVRLMPIRVLGADGGTTAALIQGIDHAVAKGAKVINLSLGSSQASRAEQEAINRAVSKGVTVVAAAGNEALAGNPLNYPAALSGVISVGALGLLPVNGQSILGKAEYSCFNPYVTIAAPGSDILSTVPTALGTYAYASGTSMAAPMVSGVAALILSRHPDWKPAQVLQALREAASPNGLTRVAGDSASGYDANFFGAGMIDASLAVAK